MHEVQNRANRLHVVGSYVSYRMEETDCRWLVCEVQNGRNRLHVVGSYVRHRMEETDCTWLVAM